MAEDRYAKYNSFEGPTTTQLAEALSKWNQRKEAMGAAVAEVIITGGQQPYVSQRMMKHKGRLSGVRVK